MQLRVSPQCARQQSAPWRRPSLQRCGLVLLIGLWLALPARADSTPDDNTALAAGIGSLIGAFDAGTIAGFVPDPFIGLGGEVLAYESNLGLKLLAPVLELPLDFETDPDPGSCFLTFNMPQTQDAFEDWYGVWNIDPIASNWGALGSPFILHANSKVIVRVRGISTGQVMLSERVHHFDWSATTQLSPVFDIGVPLVLLAINGYSEARAAFSSSKMGVKAAKTNREKLWEVFLNIGIEAGVLALDYSLDDAINDELPTARNAGPQEVTVLDVHTPFIGPSGVPEPVLEALDLGGLRMIRAMPDLLGRMTYGDTCNKTVTLSNDAPDILPVGTTLIEWTVRDTGPYKPGIPDFATYTRAVTVEDSQPPLLVAPEGFVAELPSGQTSYALESATLGLPRVIDLVDPEPTIENDAPASIPVDSRIAVNWTAKDFSNNAESRVQLVTAKLEGTNQAPSVEPLIIADTTTSVPIEIRLEGLDLDFLPTLLGGTSVDMVDPLRFEIETPPAHGEFVAPLRPFFIEDFRLTPVGETEQEGVVTSPLGPLAAEFAGLPPVQHQAWLTLKFCDQGKVIPVEMVYRPTYVHVTDDGDYIVRDHDWKCEKGSAQEIDRLSKWNAKREFLGQFELRDAHPGTTDRYPEDLIAVNRDGVISWIANQSSFGGSVYTLYHVDSDFGNIREATFFISEEELTGYTRFITFAHSDLARDLSYVHDNRGVMVHRFSDASFLGRLEIEGEALFLPGDDGNPFTPLPPDVNCPLPFGATRSWMDTDSTGALYVTDACRHRILKFAPSELESDGSFTPGAFIGWMGRCSENVAPYSGCDEANEVSRGFACSDTTCLRNGGKSGDAPGQFDRAGHLNIDPNDQLYVADTGNFRVQRFGADGTFSGQANSDGTGVNMGESPGFVLGNMGEPGAVSVNSTSFFVLENEPTYGDYFLHVFDAIPFTPIEVQPGHPNDKDEDLYEDNAVHVTYVSRFNFPGRTGLPNGTDSFEWLVSDGISDSNVGTVEVAIQRAFRPPEQHALRCSEPGSSSVWIPCELDEDTVLDVELIAKDPDGIVGFDGLDILSYQVTMPVDNGSWQLMSQTAASVRYRYTPDPDFNGIETIEYAASDGTDTTHSGPLEIVVHKVDDEPSWKLTSVVAPRGFPARIALEMNDIDADFDETIPDHITFHWGNGDSEIPGEIVETSPDEYELTGPILSQITPGRYLTTGTPTYEIDPPVEIQIAWQYDPDGYHDPSPHLESLGLVETFDAANVTLELSPSTDEPLPGDAVTITATVENRQPQGWAGIAADGTTVAVEIGPGLDYTSVPVFCTPGASASQIDCALGDMLPGASIGFPVLVRVDPAALPRPSNWIRFSASTDSPNVSMQREIEVLLRVDWPDSDSDGMPDAWEIAFGLNPNLDDAADHADNDGLSNGDEFAWGTDPTLEDSDADGLLDSTEVEITKTNPNDPDTDGDGMPDGWEFDNETRPNVADAYADSDGDGVSNRMEFLLGTNAASPDTDGDGIDDGRELFLRLGYAAINGGQTSALLDVPALEAAGFVVQDYSGEVVLPGELGLDSAGFPVNSRTSVSPGEHTTFLYDPGAFFSTLGGVLGHVGLVSGVILAEGGASFGDFALRFDELRIPFSEGFVLESTTGEIGPVFDLANLVLMDVHQGGFELRGDLLLTPEIAKRFGAPERAGEDVGDVLVRAIPEPSALLLGVAVLISLAALRMRNRQVL